MLYVYHVSRPYKMRGQLLTFKRSSVQSVPYISGWNPSPLLVSTQLTLKKQKLRDSCSSSLRRRGIYSSHGQLIRKAPSPMKKGRLAVCWEGIKLKLGCCVPLWKKSRLHSNKDITFLRLQLASPFFMNFHFLEKGKTERGNEGCSVFHVPK